VLVQDITTYLSRFDHATSNYIFRQGNTTADWLAQFGLSLHFTTVWDVVPHRDFGRIIVDCIAYLSYKKIVYNR